MLPPMVPGTWEKGNSSRPAHRAPDGLEKMEGKWPMGMPAESLLTLTITDMQDRKHLPDVQRRSIESKFYGVAPLGYIGGTIIWVALRPDVARYLVVGGIPESRVPASLLLLAGSIVLAIAGFASLRSEIRLVHSRERFLANVSHELRTPLQQILMFVQLLRLGRTRTEAEKERSLEIIETETHRLIALSNSVLAAARPDAQVQSAPVDVAQVARTAADFFLPLAQARKMRLTSSIPEHTVARGDPGAFGRF